MKKYNHKNFKLIACDEDKGLHKTHKDGYSFPDETYGVLASICEILKGIRDRLILEGYSIIQGEVIPPKEAHIYESNSNPKRHTI